LSELQDDFDEDGEVELPPKMSKELGAVFKSAVVSDEEVYETIQREERLGYLPCPQTAIAIAALDAVDDVDVDVPRVVLAVSHPSKFPDVIRAAVPQLSNGASHPTVEAMNGLFHRRRTCSLEELERSLRRDIAALTSLRSPGPIAIERALLSSEEYERIYLSTFVKTHKTKRWTALDNPLLTVVVALVVAVWAKAASPPRDTSAATERRAAKVAAKAAAKAADAERRRRAKLERRASMDARKRAARDVKAPTARASPTPSADVLAGVRPRAYARDRREARPPNVAFAREPTRRLE